MASEQQPYNCSTYWTSGLNQTEMTTEEKDLGVIFTKDLKFFRHIAMAANKANRVVGSIRQAFRYINRTIFTQLYE